MKIFRFIILLVGVTLLINSGEYIAKKGKGVSKISEEKRLKVDESFGRLPLSFIRNDGQVDEKVKYYERGRGRTTFFTEEGVYVVLSRVKGGNKAKDKIERIIDRHDDIDTKREIETEYVVIKPYKGEKGVEIEAEGELSGKVNYFIGNDPTKWRTDIPTYSKVRYKKIYKGIDLVFYGNQRELEYDLVVGSDGDLSKVSFLIEGAKGVRSTEEGLEIELANGGMIVQKLPHIYQGIEGKKVEVSGRFDVKKTENGEYLFGFDVSDYDKRYALIIDPLVLSYSTYLGGSDNDKGSGMALDAQGSVYVTGGTTSLGFPTRNAFQESYKGLGNFDAFITKISPDGRNLIYSTYLGGYGGDDVGIGIAVDIQGNAYITGYTGSTDFPIKNPYQGENNSNLFGCDAFITQLSSDGNSLVFSTYLGGGSGDDVGIGIVVDTQGNAYITGFTESSSFPTQNPYQSSNGGSNDAFITKLSSDGQRLIYSTYLGGVADDSGAGIALDTQGNVYVTGITNSNNFPTKNPYQSSNGGSDDVFIAKLSSDGKSLIYSTYLGGKDEDNGTGIAVDPQGNVYITGLTFSNNFPTNNAYQSSIGGSDDVFIAKLSSDGKSLIYSTYLGGIAYDSGTGIALDAQGNVYVTGYTTSTNFPIKNPYQANNNGEYDAFITKLSSDGQRLIYSTYLGGKGEDDGTGIALDTQGNVYVAGFTKSMNFPTKNPYQGDIGNGYDVFITKVNGIIINTLTVSKVGNGDGSVTSNPMGINCGNDCNEEYQENTAVTLAATPNNGSGFSGWSGDCAGCGGNVSCEITMDGDKNCTATFNISRYALEISKSGDGSGNVTSMPEGISCGKDCKKDYNYNTTVILTAKPDDGSKFSGWSGDCKPVGSVQAQVVMNTNKRCVAKFALRKYNLTVTKIGNGTGTVSSDPEGIDCGEDCEEEYSNSTSVVVKVIPDKDSIFVGWSGDCEDCGNIPECEIVIDRDIECNAMLSKKETDIYACSCSLVE